jgi:hypothetical protein
MRNALCGDQGVLVTLGQGSGIGRRQRLVGGDHVAPYYDIRWSRFRAQIGSGVWPGPWVEHSGFLIAGSIGQRLGPRSRPPHVTTEAIREALIKTRLIELRQACLCRSGFVAWLVFVSTIERPPS